MCYNYFILHNNYKNKAIEKIFFIYYSLKNTLLNYILSNKKGKFMEKSLKMDLAEQVEFYANNFIEYNLLMEKSNRTIDTYKVVINSFSEYCYFLNDSVKNLQSITKNNITDYFIWLDNEKAKSVNKNKRKALSINSKAYYLLVIKIFFKFITSNNDELLDLDNILGDFKFKTKKKTKIDNFMNDNEREKILNYIELAFSKKPSKTNARNSLLVKFMMKSGLRVSETLALKFGDFQSSDDGKFYDINILAKGGRVSNGIYP